MAARLGAHEDPVDAAGGERAAPGRARKKDGVRVNGLRVRLQEGVQVRGEHDVAVLLRAVFYVPPSPRLQTWISPRSGVSIRLFPST